MYFKELVKSCHAQYVGNSCTFMSMSPFLSVTSLCDSAGLTCCAPLTSPAVWVTHDRWHSLLMSWCCSGFCQCPATIVWSPWSVCCVFHPLFPGTSRHFSGAAVLCTSDTSFSSPFFPSPISKGCNLFRCSLFILLLSHSRCFNTLIV